MDTNFLILIIITVVINGLLAGGSFVKVTVELPARHKIGALIFAKYARSADLANGFYIYPVLGVGGAASVFICTIIGLLQSFPVEVMIPLYLGSACSVIHTFFTTRAAPIMIQVGHAKDDEETLRSLLNRFAWFSNWRAVFQVLGFIIVLWALVIFIQ